MLRVARTRIAMTLVRRNYAEGICCSYMDAQYARAYSTAPSGVQHDDGSRGPSTSDSKTVVLLFGWLGAADRHLLKYVDVYESYLHETNVLVVKPSIAETSMPSVGERNMVESMRERILPWIREEKRGRSNVHIIIHCMSNAGWIAIGTMFYMEQELRRTLADMHVRDDSTAVDDGIMQDKEELERDLQSWEEMRTHLRGIVLDSCPSLALPNVWAKGLISAVTEKNASEVGHAYPWILSMANSLSRRYFDSPEVLKRFRKIREAWNVHIPRVPQLYLYSTADALIPHSHVESFASQQSTLGSDVYTAPCTDADHCAILKKHPSDYRAHVYSFLDKLIITHHE
ncbi:hypothetical protein M9435_003112 [Picochlorum sp. BPE23]|nr:hypothetical protein M9435_003112 [Picochlorum sp. BPE23]